jgi:hypothetical protein
MSGDDVVKPWTIRSTLIAVANLERSIGFFAEVAPFGVIARQDAVAVLGDVSTGAAVLILRETRSLHQTRHGPQSLGLRSITFNVGSPEELDRVESVLRSRDRFTERRRVGDGASEIVRGRDPDNQPLAFVYYAADTAGADYYASILNLIYAMDA